MEHTRESVIVKDGTLVCPSPTCEHDEFRYLEDIVCYRDGLVIEDGKLRVASFYESGEGYDDGMHPRLECQECFEQYDIPEGLELDFY